MTRWRCLRVLLFVSLFSGGCDKHTAKKPDLSKGRETGIDGQFTMEAIEPGRY